MTKRPVGLTDTAPGRCRTRVGTWCVETGAGPWDARSCYARRSERVEWRSGNECGKVGGPFGKGRRPTV